MELTPTMILNLALLIVPPVALTEHIRRIRAKFLSLGDRPYIETVWGCGYRWKN